VPREGSPWAGFGAVYAKELADHLTSMRMRVLEWLVVLTGLAAIYGAIQDTKSLTAADRFLFLHLFIQSRDPLPSFIALIGFLIPLVAIALGFDAINSEFNRRTMSRVLAQPLYRDALLMGKFMAGLSTLAISLIALWLLVFGLGLVLLGVPPSTEEAFRALAFLVVAIFYAGVWLSAAILFSITFRSAATAAMCSIGLWLFLSILWPVLVPFLVQAFVPIDPLRLLLGIPDVTQIYWTQGLSRLSPNTLFMESVVALLDPTTRSLGPLFMSDLVGAVRGAALPLQQSLLLIWPQLTGLIAGTLVLFVIGYILFQRQEIRA
jgi:ABC-2 type transport system permease protein